VLIAVQANDIKLLKPATDSTLAIAFELQNLGCDLFFYTPEHLFLSDKKVFATGSHIKLDFSDDDFYRKSKDLTLDLSKADAVLIRQDPPFNMHYISSTYILDSLPKTTRILNSPLSLRNYSEKFLPFHFPKYALPTLISQDIDAFEKFFKKHKSVIIKPLYEFAGHGVELIADDRSFKTKVKKAIETGQYFIMQKYMPSVIEKGDKRALFVNGKLLCAFSKIPQKGKITANLAAGGTPVTCKLTNREEQMCKEIGKKLKKLGIFFAGADILDGYLLEINITSPTGVRAANKLYGKNFGKLIASEITNCILR
jgi:glutathione synthase